MHARPWKPDEIEWFKKVLACHTDIGDACRYISGILGRTVRTTHLTDSFVSRGLLKPHLYLKRPGQMQPALPEYPGSQELPPFGRMPYLRGIGAPSSDRSAPTGGEPAKVVEEDPVARARSQQEESRLKREHRDLVDRLREAEARQTVLDRLSSPVMPPKIIRREKTSGLREGAAIIMASDWHVEENVELQATAGRNEYNLKIADQRSNAFFRSARSLLDFSRTSWKIRDVILWLGGDLMTGYIHPELEESNELTPIETIIWLRQKMVDGITTLLQDDEIERLIIPCTGGNHGRVHLKKRIKTGLKNSYEWLLYQWLATHFENEPRVRFEAGPVAHQYVEVFDRTTHWHHGDEVSYWGGSGGLSIPLNKRVPKWDNVRKADYHFIGHFHQFLDLGHTIINGSLIGYTEFAFSIGAEYEPPRQAFCVVDSEKGKCMTAPMWVSEAA